MDLIASAPPESRTVPTKVTMPPMVVLPRVSVSISRPTSKSSRWTRIMAASTAGHGRKQRHFVARLEQGVPADMATVDCDAQRPPVLQRFGEAGPARLQPIDERCRRGNAGGQIEGFLGLADLGLEPGEVQQPHGADLGVGTQRRKPYAMTSLNGRKSTVPPSSTWLKPSGISTKPSDSTIEVRMPAPSRGNFSATQPVSPGLRRARRYSVRLPFLSYAKPETTRNSRGGASSAPDNSSTSGRASSRNVTITATGLPGKPMNGMRPIWPIATGRPGLIASRQKCSRPSASTAALTWSSSPLETPPDVTTRS